MKSDDSFNKKHVVNDTNPLLAACDCREDPVILQSYNVQISTHPDPWAGQLELPLVTFLP